jgi:hypothetical protein
MIPLVSDFTPTPRAPRGGDDLEEIAKVAAKPVDLPDDQGVTGAQVGQAFVPLGPVGLGPGRGVGVDLQAVLAGQRVELELRVLVGGGDPGVSDLMSHGRWPMLPWLA